MISINANSRDTLFQLFAGISHIFIPDKPLLPLHLQKEGEKKQEHYRQCVQALYFHTQRFKEASVQMSVRVGPGMTHKASKTQLLCPLPNITHARYALTSTAIQGPTHNAGEDTRTHAG